MKIPDHELVRRIGQGSYGEVWLARTVFGGYRAAKFLFRQTFRDPQPFQREISGIERFEPISRSHSGFVHILHVGRNDAKDYFYYLMELADDANAGQAFDPETYTPRTLASDIAHHRRLPLEECIQLAIDLVSALAQLHENGLVHRDIKPANIVFVRGQPKLADIGLVADIRDARSFVGTEGFIPPEGPGSPQADIYSLGKVIYEAVTGNDRQQFPELPADLTAFEDVDRFFEFNEIIVKAGDPNREHRYANARAMLAELELLKAGRSIKKLRKRERALTTARRYGPAALAACIALGGLLIYGEHNRAVQERLVQDNVRSALSLGSQALDRGSPLESLPYYVAALRNEEENPARNRAHRMRIACALAAAPKLTQVWSYPSSVLRAEFTKDGANVLIVSDQVELREVASGKTIQHWTPLRPLRTAVLSPDGQLLLMCDTRGELSLWGADGKIRRKIGLNVSAGARFNHAGNKIVSAGSDGVLRLFDLNGELLNSASANASLLLANFSPNDTLIVSCSRKGQAMLWDAKTLQRVGAVMDVGGFPSDAAFDPTGARLVTASLEGAARIWRMPGGEDSAGVRGGASFTSVAYSPDGLYIVTGSNDGRVQLWIASQAIAAPHNPVLLHTGRVQSAVFAPDSRRVITACSDGAVRIWDLADAQFQPTMLCINSRASAELPDLFAPEKRPFNGEAYLSNSYVISIADDSRTVSARPLNGKNGGCQVKLLVPNTLENLFVTASGHVVASVLPNAIHIHGTTRPNDSPIVIKDAGDVDAVAFGLTARLFAYASGRSVRIFMIGDDRAEPAGVYQAPGAIRELTFSNDGKQLLVCLEDQVIEGANSKIVAADDHGVVLLDLATSQPAKRPFVHNHHVSGSYPSADKTAYLSVIGEGLLRIWDSASGQPRTPQLEAQRRYTAISFLPDSHSILGVEGNGSRAWLWKLPPDNHTLDELQQLSSLLNGQQPREFWTALSQKHPADFQPAAPDIARWHRECGHLFETQQHWSAAALHWRQLLALNPADGLAAAHLNAINSAHASP